MSEEVDLSIDGLVRQVVGHAVARAADQDGREAVAHAVLSALAEVHGLFVHGSGLGAARQLEDALRERLLQLALEQRRGGSEPVFADMPQSAYGRRADLLLAEAVRTCLSVNAIGPGNVTLERAAHVLLEHLIKLLGGPPHWDALAGALAKEAEAEGRAEQALAAPRPLLQ